MSDSTMAAYLSSGSAPVLEENAKLKKENEGLKARVSMLEAALDRILGGYEAALSIYSPKMVVERDAKVLTMERIVEMVAELNLGPGREVPLERL